MNPINKKTINGSHLKLIAIIIMLIDHVGYFILDFLPNTHEVLFSVMDLDFSPYFITRFIGRSAFPIFSFLLVEGFLHTHDLRKYGQNLLLFAFISEIPWNLIHSNHLFYEKQNVFFTLFFGYLALCVLKKFKTHLTKLIFLSSLILILSSFINADYGYVGILFICAVYILRLNPMLMTSIGTCLLPSKWIGGLAFIPIAFYNGERGFIKGNFTKYAFYIFYPGHLLLLYLIKLLIFC